MAANSKINLVNHNFFPGFRCLGNKALNQIYIYYKEWFLNTKLFEFGLLTWYFLYVFFWSVIPEKVSREFVECHKYCLEMKLIFINIFYKILYLRVKI